MGMLGSAIYKRKLRNKLRSRKQMQSNKGVQKRKKDKGKRGKFTNPRTLETSSVSSGAGIELAWCPAW